MSLDSRRILGAASLLLLLASPARAWDFHQSLMRYVVDGLDPELRARLEAAAQPPTAAEDRAMYLKLARELKLKTGVRLPPSLEPGAKGAPIDVLLGKAVEDPDAGIDRDLIEEYADAEIDPRSDRKYSGGKSGASSQGFRHMFFGGWKLSKPIATFQVPTRPLGQAIERTQLIAERGRTLIREGQVLWGTRLVAWAMHYVQDLAQPFHAVQVPHLGMVPWGSLLKWPPSEGFEELVRETTRTISNYHRTYELYSYSRLMSGEANPFAKCLNEAEKRSSVAMDPRKDSPADLARLVTAASVGIASRVGSANMGFFGSKLKEARYDLNTGKTDIDYEAYARDPKLQEEREELHEVTCEALANAIAGSRQLLRWAFLPPT